MIGATINTALNNGEMAAMLAVVNIAGLAGILLLTGTLGGLGPFMAIGFILMAVIMDSIILLSAYSQCTGKIPVSEPDPDPDPDPADPE
jgi:hypothetical protein